MNISLKDNIFKSYVLYKKKCRNHYNRLLYGGNAPQSDQRLYIDPKTALLYRPAPQYEAPRFRRQDSGRVRAGTWDQSVSQIGETIKYRNCVDRFVNGKSWQETGIFDMMMQRIARDGICDGCRNLEEIETRYEKLDELFLMVQREGRLCSRQDMDPSRIDEADGIFVHIARDGTPLRSGGGGHRFSIALICGLREIPVQIGVVHRDCVTSGLFQKLPKDRNLMARGQ